MDVPVRVNDILDMLVQFGDILCNFVGDGAEVVGKIGVESLRNLGDNVAVDNLHLNVSSNECINRWCGGLLAAANPAFIHRSAVDGFTVFLLMGV